MLLQRAPLILRPQLAVLAASRTEVPCASIESSCDRVCLSVLPVV
jgi:hypothetical protein